MKGIIFNLLGGYLTDRFGEDKYEEILSSCKLQSDDPFTMVSPATYADADFGIIAAKAAEILKMSIPDLLREMGTHAMPKLAERYPGFFTDYDHPADFLKTASFIHEIEVKKLYKDADVPKFTIESETPEQMILSYNSKRRLCHLVEGLLTGLGNYYNIPLKVKQTECQISGGQQCVFLLKFADSQKTSSKEQ